MVTVLRRNLFKRHYLALLMITVALLACRCNTSVLIACEAAYGKGNGGECYNRYDAMCPEDLPVTESMGCEAAFYRGEEYIPGSIPAAPANPQNSQSVAPPAQMACDFLRLTAPLDGLPNGGTTFYWDPLPFATGYNISLYDSGNYLAGYNAPAGTTNLGADVSQGAIGGGYSITIVLTASGPNGQSCSTSATVFRAAPENPQPGAPSNPHDSNQPAPQEPVDPCPPGYNGNECIR